MAVYATLDVAIINELSINLKEAEYEAKEVALTIRRTCGIQSRENIWENPDSFFSSLLFEWKQPISHVSQMFATSELTEIRCFRHPLCGLTFFF